MSFDCPEKLQFGEYSLDSSGALLHNGQPIKIQPQPLTVLRKLLERPGQLVSPRGTTRASVG
jgi:DNA-binding winged helix-turn-helix (wHTH) protein